MNSAEEWRLVLLAAGAAFTLVGMASRKEPRRAAAFILAWLLPGAGHVAMGKWKKGLFFLLLLGTVFFAIGLSRLIDSWLEVQGIGYLITGTIFILALPMAFLAMTRRPR